MVLAVTPKLLDIRLGLGFMAIAVVTAIAFYLVRKLRDHVLKEEPLTGSELKEFEEIHSQGDISPEEFLDAGFREEFNRENVCIVEWPEKADGVLPPPDLHVYLSVAGDGRDVELQPSSALGTSCLQRLQFAPNL